jgi:hypothetical protein
MAFAVFQYPITHCALALARSKKFAIASKSIFKSHDEKTSWFTCGSGVARDRAWEMKKILYRNNVEQERKRNFFNRLEATAVGKSK